MPNSVEFQVRWEKVESGLRMARIDEQGIRFLTDKFNAVAREYAEQVLEGGSSAMFNRSADLKTNRDLFRAFNFIAAVRANAVGVQYGTNVAVREQFWSGQTDRAGLERIIRDEYDALRRDAQIQNAAFMAIKVPVQQQPAPTAIPTRTPVLSPQLQAIEAAARRQHRDVVVDLKLKFLEKDLSWQRSEAAVANAKNAWFRAKQDIINKLVESQINQVFQFTLVINAVDDAFKAFEHITRANNEGIKKRLNLIGKLVTALIPDKAPFKYFAQAITTGIGLLEVGAYDSSAKYVAMTGSNASRFSKALGEGLKAYNQSVSLVDLQRLRTPGDFKDQVSVLSRALLEAMRGVTARVLNETFGTETDGVFDAYYAAYAQQRPHADDTARAQLFIQQQLSVLKADAEAVIDSHLTYKWMGGEAGQLGNRIKMGMVCAYLIEVFDGSSAGLSLPIDDQIVNYLGSNQEWGILIQNSTYREAAQKLRIYWDGGKDHKQALLLFCRWYVRNVNPFHILVNSGTGEKHIQQACERHILLINKAIDAGTGIFGLDWTRVASAYQGACAGAGAVDWETVDFDSMIDS